MEILLRAATWHEAEDNYAQAIEHALAAHEERLAAELLNRHIQALFDGTDLVSLRPGSTRLPTHR